ILLAVPAMLFTLSLDAALPIYPDLRADLVGLDVRVPGQHAGGRSVPAVLKLWSGSARALRGSRGTRAGSTRGLTAGPTGYGRTTIGRAHVCTPVTFKARIPAWG